MLIITIFINPTNKKNKTGDGLKGYKTFSYSKE